MIQSQDPGHRSRPASEAWEHHRSPTESVCRTVNDHRTTDADTTTPGVDTTLPHSARVYDYCLGGKTNFAPDRDLGQALEHAIPSIRAMARENRAFLGRAVRHLAREAGIRQFLDIGTGIPADVNTHEIAQAVAPHARVVYADNDPIVLAHARARLVGNGVGSTAHLAADLREPEALLADPVLRGTLDLDRPVGLLLVGVLMLVADEDDPWGSVGVLLDALPPGSHVVVSHPSQDFNPQAVASAVAAARRGRMTVVPRPRAQVVRFLADWEPLDPGVVPVMAWRPDGPPPRDPEAVYYYAGVARKPV